MPRPALIVAYADRGAPAEVTLDFPLLPFRVINIVWTFLFLYISFAV